MAACFVVDEVKLCAGRLGERPIQSPSLGVEQVDHSTSNYNSAVAKPISLNWARPGCLDCSSWNRLITFLGRSFV